MKIIVGDLIKSVSEGHILHGCNARGVMGGGFALYIRNRYPNVYEEYLDIYEREGLKLGQAIPVKITKNLTVWNLITQEGFGTHTRQTDYSAVRMAFENFKSNFNGGDIHHPLIGCGLGGGQWCIVDRIIKDVMDGTETNLWVLTEQEKLLYTEYET
jgi:O-acetyl-ADP-ribose deacetylase (regulator of RNase III)